MPSPVAQAGAVRPATVCDAGNDATWSTMYNTGMRPATFGGFSIFTQGTGGRLVETQRAEREGLWSLCGYGVLR